MAGSAQSAVDSLLGTLATVIGDEARLLRGVRGDVRFIKDEMESMNGFLLDVADAGHQPNNQARAWMRQVRDVAYDSQNCIDRYVQTFGAHHPSAGLLGSVRQVPHLVRTMPDRHRIATQIRELRSRALEVGERRQRYGVKAILREQAAAHISTGEDVAEEEDEQRHTALPDTANLLDIDARARQVIAWLRGERAQPGSSSLGSVWIAKSKYDKLVVEMLNLGKGLVRKKYLDNQLQVWRLRLFLLTPRFRATKVVTDKKDFSKEAVQEHKDEMAVEVPSGEARKVQEENEKTKKSMVLDGDNPKKSTEGHESSKEAVQEQSKVAMERALHERIEELSGEARKVQEVNERTKKSMVLDGDNPKKSTEGHESSKEAVQEQSKVVMERVLRERTLRERIEELSGEARKVQEVNERTKKKVRLLLRHMAREGGRLRGLGGGWLMKMVLDGDNPEKSTEGDESSKEEEEEKQQQQQQEKQQQEEEEEEEEEEEGGGKHNQKEKENKPSALEVQHTKKLIRWLKGIFRDDHLRAKLLAIVTPPVDASNPEAHKSAADLARAVYDHPDAASHFNFKVWVDAKLNSTCKQRLQRILKEAHPSCIEDPQISTWDEKRLGQEIQQHLKDKKFLIVLADHEDHSPWADITKALPPDHSSNSAIIVTPMIQQTPHFHGWYIASYFFLLRDSPCNIHFLSYLDAAREKAIQLLDGSNCMEGSQGIVDNILKRCRWDSFSTKMVLHALYADPHRSKEDLKKLLLRLRNFSTVSNAKQIIRFCYDDLPSHYKICLLYLSIFPLDSKIRRTSLLRRWVAEKVITGRHELTALDEAERGFNALVARGLVLPCGSGPQGKVKFCKVHSHVVSFITKIAREENVGNTHLKPEFAHCLSIRNGIQLQQVSKKRQATYSNTCWRLHKPPADIEDPSYDMVTFLNLLPASSQLGSVKVLDLEGCNGLTKQNIKNICNKLFQLKYLSLRNTDVTEMPKEIEKLRYLETFDIRQTKIQSFPAKAIVMLQKLVHLFAGHNGPDETLSTIHMPRGIGTMTNMQIFSHVEVSEEADERELIKVGRLQQLRKLGVVIHGNEANLLKLLLRVIGKLHECLCSLSVRIEPIKTDIGVFRSKGEDGDGEVDDMNTNDKTFSPPKSLVSLGINGWISGLPTWIKELNKLSKITLCGTYLKDIDIRLLGELVNLHCIMLRHKSYNDKKLTLRSNEFKKLQLLVIEGSDVSDIHFEHNGAPNLEKIVWTSDSMEKLHGIDQLLSLKKIELNSNCNLNRIIDATKANPNHLIITHNPIPKVTEAADASDIPCLK